jgi:hypothetical protein
MLLIGAERTGQLGRNRRARQAGQRFRQRDQTSCTGRPTCRAIAAASAATRLSSRASKLPPACIG